MIIQDSVDSNDNENHDINGNMIMSKCREEHPLQKDLYHPTTGLGNSSYSSSSVKKIRVYVSLTVFHKYDQLDLFKASNSISDYLTSIFPKNFWIF